MTTSPAPVIDEIRRHVARTGRFELTADRVRELLGADHAEFYRRIYEQTMEGNPAFDISIATQRFEEENIGELVTLLELFLGPEVEVAFERAGLFLPHPARFELQRLFLEIAGRAAAAHTLRREEFSAMLRRFGSYRRARRAYLDEHFSVAELRETAAGEFARSRPFDDPHTAAATALRILEEYFRRHVLERESVLASVAVALFEVAVAEGFARRPEETRGSATGDGEAGAEAGSGARTEAEERGTYPLQWARRVMELGGRHITRSGLKGRYKSLMKRYHPDVNPRGLRTCQRINEAYNILLASAVDSS